MMQWRLKLLVFMFLWHFGVTVTSYGWIPCPQQAANEPAEKVALPPVAKVRAGLGRPTAAAWNLHSAAYRFWWEAKDSIRFGFPYMVQNDRATLGMSGLCVIAVAYIACRSCVRLRVRPVCIRRNKSNSSGLKI